MSLLGLSACPEQVSQVQTWQPNTESYARTWLTPKSRYEVRHGSLTHGSRIALNMCSPSVACREEILRGVPA